MELLVRFVPAVIRKPVDVASMMRRAISMPRSQRADPMQARLYQLMEAEWIAAHAGAWHKAVDPYDYTAVGPSVAQIVAAVAKKFGLSEAELLARRRRQDIVRPRQLAIGVAARVTMKSLTTIGHAFNRLDHTTVLHAIRVSRPYLDSLNVPRNAQLAQWIIALDLEEFARLRCRRGSRTYRETRRLKHGALQ